MTDPKAVFVIEALMDALDAIKDTINSEDATPEETVFKVNEALRVAHEYVD